MKHIVKKLARKILEKVEAREKVKFTLVQFLGSAETILKCIRGNRSPVNPTLLDYKVTA